METDLAAMGKTKGPPVAVIRLFGRRPRRRQAAGLCPSLSVPNRVSGCWHVGSRYMELGLRGCEQSRG
jgi:hypothetical protein